MINNFSIGAVAERVLTDGINLRFRDHDMLTHNASDAGKCNRAIAYKKYKTKESNPTDLLGKMRMETGNYLEKGLMSGIFDKMAPFDVIPLQAQGDVGEYDFYGTRWHGYVDKYLGIKTPAGKVKPIVVELKTKVGYGAWGTIKKTQWSRDYITPMPDTQWGYAQQIALYLRNAYNKTKGVLSEPIVDGILLYYLYGDGICGFLEFRCEYNPETDSVTFYEVYSKQFPGCNGKINLVINLKDIADKWTELNGYLTKGEMPPPGFTRRYELSDPRINDFPTTQWTAAAKNDKILGDIQCAYCAFRDTCAKDLGVVPEYSASEIKQIKEMIKKRKE